MVRLRSTSGWRGSPARSPRSGVWSPGASRCRRTGSRSSATGAKAARSSD